MPVRQRRSAVTVDELRVLLGHWATSQGSLYQLLASRLARLIDDNALPPAVRLPSERTLAKALSVSRRTVEAAYDQLRSSGRLISRVGAGTWTAARPEDTPASASVRASHIGLLAERTESAIDLTAAALPAHPLVGTARDATRNDLVQLQRRVSGYYPSGLESLRERICAWFEAHGIPTKPDQVLVTSGAVQALWLAASLLPRGATVYVENPTSPSVLTALRAYRHRLVAVPVDERGLRTPKPPAPPPRAVFVTPAYHNPTGACLSEHRIRELAALAHDDGTLIVEDLTLLDLRLTGRAPGTIAALAPHSRVLSIGSMSKWAWAGLRVGWLRGPARFIRDLTRIRGTADLGTSVDAQLQAAWLLDRRAEVLADRIPSIRQQQNALLTTLTERLPQWTWNRPNGGLSLWVELPGPMSEELRQRALRKGLRLLPGSDFQVVTQQDRHLRLPYVLEPDLMRAAVVRLADCYREINGSS